MTVSAVTRISCMHTYTRSLLGLRPTLLGHHRAAPHMVLYVSVLLLVCSTRLLPLPCTQVLLYLYISTKYQLSNSFSLSVSQVHSLKCLKSSQLVVGQLRCLNAKMGMLQVTY